jgi:hypothetical protein
MRALSIRQPWAGLISLGQKNIELRTWRTHYRGELLIVSSAKKLPVPYSMQDTPGFGFGVAVAIVELVNCREATPEDAERACCPISPGEYAWELRLVLRVAPVPIKGKLNFFEVDDSLIR